jgi:hypothetical protein
VGSGSLRRPLAIATLSRRIVVVPDGRLSIFSNVGCVQVSRMHRQRQVQVQGRCPALQFLPEYNSNHKNLSSKRMDVPSSIKSLAATTTMSLSFVSHVLCGDDLLHIIDYP